MTSFARVNLSFSPADLALTFFFHFPPFFSVVDIMARGWECQNKTIQKTLHCPESPMCSVVTDRPPQVFIFASFPLPLTSLPVPKVVVVLGKLPAGTVIFEGTLPLRLWSF